MAMRKKRLFERLPSIRRRASRAMLSQCRFELEVILYRTRRSSITHSGGCSSRQFFRTPEMLRIQGDLACFGPMVMCFKVILNCSLFKGTVFSASAGGLQSSNCVSRSMARPLQQFVRLMRRAARVLH